MSSSTAESWTCDGCAVSVSQVDGTRTALPTGWENSSGGRFCLVCSRSRAAEAALDSAPEGCTRGDRAKLRRAALLEFEVRRVPDLPDSTIARACRSSASAVAAARRRLQEREPGMALTAQRAPLRKPAKRR